jgi:hypothetical protein
MLSDLSVVQAVAVLSLPLWLIAEAVLGSLPPTAPPSRRSGVTVSAGRARLRQALAILGVAVAVASGMRGARRARGRRA